MASWIDHFTAHKPTIDNARNKRGEFYGFHFMTFEKLMQFIYEFAEFRATQIDMWRSHQCAIKFYAVNVELKAILITDSMRKLFCCNEGAKELITFAFNGD